MQQRETKNEVVADVVLKPHDVYTPFQWNRGNVARWVAAALLCWIFSDIYRTGLDTLRSFQDADSIIAILIALAVFILCGLLLFPYLRVRALFRRSPQLRKQITYTFDSGGMHFKSDTSNGTCTWPGFDRVTETRKVFTFSVTDRAATYLPKRCLATIDDIARLRQLIRENFKGKHQLRSD